MFEKGQRGMPRQARTSKRTAIDLPSHLVAEIEAIAKVNRFPSPEAYIRFLHSKFRQSKGSYSPPPKYKNPRVYYRESGGRLYHGDSLGLLYNVLKPNSVDLIVTSPPFGLVRQKAYGNEAAENYVSWFSDFAHGFWRVLKETGSLVIDIGGAWNPGRPTKSLYQFNVLQMLCEEVGFQLAQDLYWWNPARMPSPAEWVTIERTRLTDSVNCVWWLSKSDRPKADNRKVLNPYKSSHLENIARKQTDPAKPAYNEGLRPSGHRVSSKWAK
ncbi:MAG TPA: DNA methyltransferase, partial [Stellaceae bacterium]|nr:DNA methyltransferase [Stellaceae bacterium]